jgi:hypothetical protein
MKVRELIDFLNEQPADAEVELAIVAPIVAGSDDITIDRYLIDGVMPWNDEDEDGGHELVVWLIGGEDSDFEQFLNAIEES